LRQQVPFAAILFPVVVTGTIEPRELGDGIINLPSKPDG
jgi:hypothetical protein